MLWTITSFFNPVGYRRRRENFRIFRQHLPTPLVAIELSFGRAFELDDSDAEIVLRVSSGDVMWQKERLLNLALRALPGDCRNVAWLDCDVVLADEKWHEQAATQLKEYTVLQLYRRWKFLSESADFPAQPHIAQEREALIGTLRDQSAAQNASIRELRSTGKKFAWGAAWAARRDHLERYGFYDGCIIGGGDLALSFAAWGEPQTAVDELRMNERQQQHYLAWAHPFAEATANRVGCLSGDLFHLWHGTLSGRQSRERFSGLRPFQFDPARDIQIGPDGSWIWCSDKPHLHRYVSDYFVKRCEDGSPAYPQEG